jgi:hypothetical protein
MARTEYFKSIQIDSETSSTSGDTILISKTLIIFDFDDTLFCTKYFDTFSIPYKDIFNNTISLEEINPGLVIELKQLENTILELFNNLQKKYDIIIISNAEIKWINNCMIYFFEQLNEYINDNKIKIYSAKNIFSKLIKDKTKWKIKCFKKVIKELYKKDINIDLNVISIGDGIEEKEAVFNLTKNTEFNKKIKPKYINMISFPSASSIILQLKYLNDNINDIILSNQSIYKMVIQIKNDNVEINCVAQKKKKNENNLIKNNNYFCLDRMSINENYNDALFYYILEEEEDNKDYFGNKLLKKRLFYN